MFFGVIQSDRKGHTDVVLADVAQRLEKAGHKLAGTVQTNIPRHGQRHCDMDVRVLSGGPVICISQSLGPAARGCRLDTGALERAVAEVERRFSPATDLLIINKFGKHEAEGRGFRNLIAEALAAGVPIICAVSRLNRAAFEAFAEGLHVDLPADADALVRRLHQCRREAA
jgi:nucleoside-triphosphatase THEP1